MGRRVHVLERPYPPLDRQACKRCGKFGITVICMWVEGEEQVPHEALYCTTGCATFDGWPWLPEEPHQRRRAQHR